MHTIITCAILGTSAAHDAAGFLFHDVRLDGGTERDCSDAAAYLRADATNGTGLHLKCDRALFTECWEWNAHIAGGDTTFHRPAAYVLAPIEEYEF